MRLFVAILLPEPVKDRLCNAVSELKRQGSGTFTRRENLHLTLAFIGETGNYKGAVRAVQTIEAEPFSLSLGEIGRVGDLYWAGAVRTEPLAKLQSQVCAALRCAGFSPDEKAFRPHLTLCRRFSAPACPDLLAVENALGKPEFTVRKVSLMNSQRLGGKLTYTELFAKQLGQ